MARMARFVVPGFPHHVTQRGVRRMDVFSCDDDYRAYLTLLKESCDNAGTKVLAYCLMTNHVHLILVPETRDGLRAALGETHRQYTRLINVRDGCTGHLWQERFHSFVMDESYTLACARYVELNPVVAGMVSSARGYKWSSARAHLRGKDDGLVSVKPLLARVLNWGRFLKGGLQDVEAEKMRLHTSTGRPLGADDWVSELEAGSGRPLKPRPRGRPKKEDE